MPVFALCDANNFYCSCERAFAPALRTQPIVVLSNNDGCCISRSQEAKDLGVKMGDPWFKIATWAQAQGIRPFSSNYALYGDMSRRFYQVLLRFSPSVEPYSIDEMFLDLSGQSGDLGEFCQGVRHAVRREAKIPTCIGIGETKTKAKLANQLAKKNHTMGGVCDLRDSAVCMALYPTIPLSEVWGIGRNSTRKLKKFGLETVADLIAIDLGKARGVLSVTGARIVMELQGISCLPVSLLDTERQSLAVTRTFGAPILEWEEMAQAVSTYATLAAEKLRHNGRVAGFMTIFLQTNRFKTEGQYSNAVNFPMEPTQDTFALVENALMGTRQIWRQGYSYWKAGVILNDLTNAKSAPESMFPARDLVKSAKLMRAMDAINGRFGTGCVRPAISSFEPRWQPKAQYLSQRYTTNLNELLRVR